MKRLLTAMTMMAAFALTAPAAANQAEIDAIYAMFAERSAGMRPDSVQPSPVAGLYEVVIGSSVIYMSGDARYVLQGRMIDTDNGRDLTEPAARSGRLAALATVPESEMIIFEPEGEVLHTLTTFTDIDCPYCRRMHAEMPQLNAAGIRVRYMLYPRAGIGSAAHTKAVNVWCAEDRGDALTRAKLGEKLPTGSCETPIGNHMELAQALGLTGTPMNITDTGEVISGYAPAPQMIQQLAMSKAAN